MHAQPDDVVDVDKFFVLSSGCNSVFIACALRLPLPEVLTSVSPQMDGIPSLARGETRLQSLRLLGYRIFKIDPIPTFDELIQTSSKNVVTILLTSRLRLEWGPTHLCRVFRSTKATIFLSISLAKMPLLWLPGLTCRQSESRYDYR